jgi:hypothetical protein
MNNVHPIFADALAPFAPTPVRVSKPLRPFSVKVMEGGKPNRITGCTKVGPGCKHGASAETVKDEYHDRD